ncbi:hypothetical protein PFICI_02468 [Pestalotiopsis fici W106-1]|uniref:Xylanolytic transcriptional activator regulatory domain-containing protein n=1 Tax=Pestalotiopsis fici (strain W106-1 / CGMCC3.15140) TaxID=1229662 RepID=W3XEB4_PESFW|nr:uncharacterized protein PFICI_02468 [Pestalotiopsis fici W106-1]ETS84443.1 hypothetical protein PFICI_02468 [Pestalotiopsis fici W106-1]
MSSNAEVNVNALDRDLSSTAVTGSDGSRRKRNIPPVRGSRRAEPPPPTAINHGQSVQQPSPRSMDHMAADPSVGTPSGPSLASRSIRANNDEANVNSPGLSHGYSLYEDSIKPDVIEGLVEVFHHTIYPIRPYFHWPTFQSQIRQQLYRSDWGIFVVTMAVCALTAGRLYSGVPGPSHLDHVRSRVDALSSECYAAAVKALPRDMATATDYCQAMRANAILASVCLQNGQLKSTIAHLGDYTTLSIMHGFYAEANWPAGLTEIEKQERRRLFWGVYQQDQYLATNFGLPSRQREAKTTVLYPAEVFDDEDISATFVRLRPDRVSFLRGWNYCTDLYRLYENMDTQLRAWQQVPEEEPRGTLNSFLARVRPTHHFASDILHLITTLHRDLPQELRTVKAMTGNPQKDRCGFVAVNILLTTNNLKMLLVGAENPNVHLRCAIASELLDELGAVPVGFFNASSTGSLHHLAHIGHVLGSAIQAPLSAWSYLQVRNILLILADFLEKIEKSRAVTPSLGAKLRVQISRIDQCMQQTRQRNPESDLVPMGQSLLMGSPTNNSSGSLAHSNDQQLSPPPTTTLAPSNQIPTLPPSISRLNRLLGVGDQTDSSQQQQSMSTLIGGSTVAQGFGFDSTFEMPHSNEIQNPGSNLVFPSLSTSSLPTDFFDGWPILSGQNDGFDPLNPFVSIGSTRG